MALENSDFNKKRIFTGPRAKLQIDGVTIGFLTNVSGSEQLEYTGVEMIGSIYTEEWVPTSYSVSLSASKLRIVGATLKSAGLMPKHGGTSKDFLDNILKQKDLAVALEDQVTGQVTATFIGVKLTSSSFSVSARGMVAEDITFLATRLYDESEVVTT